jgi:hypothetical protein
MDKKIACLFLNITLNEDIYGSDNFITNDFFSHNAINSFKKWHPEIDVHYVTDNNFAEYLAELGIEEYYNNISLIRLLLTKVLMDIKKYEKVIVLGIDTFTCAPLTEFIENEIDDMVCSSGPPYHFIQTEYWKPAIEVFEHDGKLFRDISFINADVYCINNSEMANKLYDITLKYWTEQMDQGGINYCYINQNDLGIKVKIVDFPYVKTNVLYNVRSKGRAYGGNQMHRGIVYDGNHKDPDSRVIGYVYPTSTYYVKDDKLYTSDHKQIKVFHYAEALGGKTKEEYNETLNEIKTMWFNPETLLFLTNQCNCKF